MVQVAYEVFNKKSVRNDSPTVALTPNGRIALNSATCRILADAGVKSVVVLWDNTARKLALRASKRGEQSYAITYAPDRHSGSLAAKAFMRHIGWDAKERRVFAAGWNDSQKMLEVDLNADVFGRTVAAGVIRARKNRPSS